MTRAAVELAEGPTAGARRKVCMCVCVCVCVRARMYMCVCLWRLHSMNDKKGVCVCVGGWVGGLNRNVRRDVGRWPT